MATFSTKHRPFTGRGPTRTTGKRIPTHEGGVGFAPNAETELFLAAATHMAGEGTFYEHAEARDRRLVDLVHTVTRTNPDFVVRFAPYLRNELKIRSASIMVGAEYVAAGGEGGRAVVDSVLQRGDEPAEMLGYWLSRHGRNVKMAVKRGVADGATRLYTERAALRYDGNSRAVRMADVIELTHPKPRDARQSALFRWLLDHRHHGDAVADPTVLPTLARAAELAAVPVEERRALLRSEGPDALARSGTSWERLSGWVAGGMDAEAWESALPSMGVMALIRNLRNFDEKGIGPASIETVIRRITDPDEVAKARLFPYQVWAAYANAPSDTWKRALGTTLDLTTANVPPLDRTLVVIDMSGSMQWGVSQRSTMRRVEVAAVMAAVTAKRRPRSAKATRSTTNDIVIFGHTHRRIELRPGLSVPGAVEELVSMIGSVGHATNGHTAIRAHFNPKRHDRVVLFTDDQMHDAGSVDLSHVPVVYTVDLAGYRPRSMAAPASGQEHGQGQGQGRYTLAGFSDSTFSIMKTLEAGREADWPF